MKIKKEYTRAVKDTLKCFSVLTGHLEMLKSRLDDLKGNSGLRGLSLSNTSVQTSNISRQTELTALQNIDDEKEIIGDIKRCEKKIEILKAGISKLDPQIAEIITKRYIESKSWSKVEDEMFISERNGISKVNSGIETLAIIFYGDRVIDDIYYKEIG